jgi:hypothetical protein
MSLARENGLVPSGNARTDQNYSDVILALHSRRVFTFGVAGAMARYRRTICGCLALAALAGVAGCAASGPEPPLETAYSAAGAQVK